MRGVAAVGIVMAIVGGAALSGCGAEPQPSAASDAVGVDLFADVRAGARVTVTYADNTVETVLEKSAAVSSFSAEVPRGGTVSIVIEPATGAKSTDQQRCSIAVIDPSADADSDPDSDLPGSVSVVDKLAHGREPVTCSWTNS